jgi:hypothetical protein
MAPNLPTSSLDQTEPATSRILEQLRKSAEDVVRCIARSRADIGESRDALDRADEQIARLGRKRGPQSFAADEPSTSSAPSTPLHARD